MAVAVPLSAVGNHIDTILLLAGKHGASAAPTRKRKANTATKANPTGIIATVPIRPVNTDQATMARPSTRMLPKRSMARPPGSCNSM
ncbi:hypothetical protein D9M71_836210 [compost metagenome]